MTVLIRADGSTQIGYGHLYRSNTIATALLNLDISIIYLTKTPQEAKSVCNEQAEIVSTKNLSEKCLSTRLSDLAPDAVLVDLPDASLELQRDIKEVAPLALILGSARHELCCDILINGHLFAEHEEYTWRCDEPTWCLGPKYHPLREPFPEILSRSKDCSKKPEQGLILMGGTDPHNLTPMVMEAFAPLELDVTVVVGPGNTNESNIKRKANTLDTVFEIVRNPDDLPERMFNADIAVSGFGTTIYELMATRTPFVGIARTDLEEFGATKTKSYVDLATFTKNVSVNRLETSLRNLNQSPETRFRLQQRFKELIDGEGAKRIARKIKQLEH